jgi:hypothetical protein
MMTVANAITDTSARAVLLRAITVARTTPNSFVSFIRFVLQHLQRQLINKSDVVT